MYRSGRHGSDYDSAQTCVAARWDLFSPGRGLLVSVPGLHSDPCMGGRRRLTTRDPDDLEIVLVQMREDRVQIPRLVERTCLTTR